MFLPTSLSSYVSSGETSVCCNNKLPANLNDFKKDNRILFFLFMILFAMLVYDSAMQADTPAAETIHT